VSCEICHNRKEKRFCPAIHGRICPQCCGEQREATIDCPEDCSYLQQARAREKSRTPEQLAGEELFPKVEIGQRFYYEREPLIGGLLYELTRLSGLHRDWNDRDITGALTALARGYERLAGSGIIYNESTTNPIHQAVAEELQKRIEQYRQLEQQKLGYSSLKDSDILKALVFLVRTAQVRTSGRPRARAFLSYLAEQFPEARQKAGLVNGSGSSLIVSP
jgi:hypothetical protein